MITANGIVLWMIEDLRRTLRLLVVTAASDFPRTSDHLVTRWKARCTHARGHAHWAVQLEQGEIMITAIGIVLWMIEDLRRTLRLLVVTAASDFPRTSDHLVTRCHFAVCCREDPTGIDERASTILSASILQGHLVLPFTLFRLIPIHDGEIGPTKIAAP